VSGAGPEPLAAAKAVALLGGTFDPVHFGHLRAALEARERLGVADFRLLPAGAPPHRPEPVASPQQRLDMLRLALRECPELRVDEREIRRPGPSYMVDTLEDLRRECGSVPLLLLIGQDAANALDRWHRWRELFDLAHLVVMRRPEAHFDCAGELREQIGQRRAAAAAELAASPAGRILTLWVTQLDISSTAIRALLEGGRSPRFLLPEAVLAYIAGQRLYGAR
jgi:nicotinate-nucleotide adenylyltransferase